VSRNFKFHIFNYSLNVSGYVYIINREIDIPRRVLRKMFKSIRSVFIQIENRMHNIRSCVSRTMYRDAITAPNFVKKKKKKRSTYIVFTYYIWCSFFYGYQPLFLTFENALYSFKFPGDIF